MNQLEYADAAVGQITRMADVIRGHDLNKPVPTCPGWTLRDLVVHTGSTHRRAAIVAGEARQERLDRDSVDLGLPAEDAGYADWFAAGAEPLRQGLTAHDPSTVVWTWAGPRPVIWWARRQLHENTVHGADADIALGHTLRIDERVAADGVSELLDTLPHADWNPRDLTGDGERLSWQSDTGAGFLVTLYPDGFTYELSAMPGEVTVRTATAADILLLMWGRRGYGDYAVEGDDALLKRWTDNTRM
ncbi:maleylpyruvate isomerase family mycothiol-dependent enzyme [Herbidospora mongoliensis]|uniref:maleylpyruvate isomerase family mycothiol-dependent enzyme n=1 Tax=Herbidospora mongoliensis TaxID=688067 RepID=UPI00082FBB1E|nr:maleylpyruvate isomerase family mycothiol-dependent enzyme [Herbidospora mongoliensis]